MCTVNNKELEMTEFESKCYGMTEQDIRDQYINSLTAKLSGLEMVVMSILSDCQEMQNFGIDTKEQIRKQMNVAKFILAEMMDARRNEEMVLVSSDGREIA
jgi:hypothetical protein